MKEWDQTKLKNKWLYIALMILALYLSPYFILGDNAHVRVHDNLDSNVAWYKVLVDSGKLFAGLDAEIDRIMNGLPRNSLGSEFNLVILLYLFFEPYLAYAVNQLLMRVLAFSGMYLLLKKHFVRWDVHPALIAGTSLGYAMLPYWPSGGGTIAGLPMALFAFLNFRNRSATWKDWLIIGLLPFYSSFVLSFVFFLTCMSGIWVYDSIRSKRMNGGFFWAMAVMTVVYLFVNYRIIYEMFLNPNFVSHRVGFDRGYFDAVISFLIGVGVFIVGQSHVIRLTQYIILPTIVAALVIARYKKVNAKGSTWLFFLNLLFSVVYGFYYWGGLKGIKERWPVFETFNFGRFHFLEPPIWYICFALALMIIWQCLKWGKPIASALLTAQIAVLFLHSEEIKYRHYDYVSYKQFYSEQLFDNIKAYIGRDPSMYRVVSIGIHPSIAQYNGFYTLDGYVVSYSLEYQQKFRRIIAPELAKSQRLKNYFDDWGSRCYIFTEELMQFYMYAKGSNKTVNHLNLNIEAFKDMGGEYILSAVKITNAEANNLAFLRKFENDTSRWRIYLYRAK